MAGSRRAGGRSRHAGPTLATAHPVLEPNRQRLEPHHGSGSWRGRVSSFGGRGSVVTDEPGRIEVSGLTKGFGGAVKAVDDLRFTVEPGSVTGFLGPNGAGKPTTLRCLLGLVAPTAGRATIGGRRYAHLGAPTREVGALLEASSFHPARSGRNHL